MGPDGAHVYYVSASQHLIQLWWTGIEWVWQDLSAGIAGSDLPNAASGLTIFSTDGIVPQIVFSDTVQDLERRWWQGSGWTQQDLTALVSPTTWMSLDAPAVQQTYSGNYTFGGWAMDDLSAIASVAITIDGVSFGQANYGNNRQDACNTYPDGVACPNVGYSFAFNTAKLPNGQHTFVATATTVDGRVTTRNAVFNTNNSNPTSLFIDSPQGGSTYYSGTQTFSGWAIDTVSPTRG